MARTFGFRELAGAGTWFGDHELYRFRWPAEPAQVSTSDVAFTFATLTGIALNDLYVGNLLLTETQMGGTGMGDFAPANLIAEANYNVIRSYEDTITLTAYASALTIPDELFGLVDVDNTIIYTDAARDTPLRSDQWSYAPATGTITITDQMAVGATDTVYPTLAFTVTVITFEAGAGVADGDTVYFQYDPGVLLNVRAFNDLTKANTDIYVGRTETDAIAANRIDDTNFDILTGTSAATIDVTITEGQAPDVETTDPHDPTQIILYPSGQAAPDPDEGDYLFIQCNQCTMVEVFQAEVPNTLEFAESATSGNLEGADRIDSHASRFDSISITGNLGGFEMDAVRIMGGHEYKSRQLTAQGREFVTSLQAGQTRPAFRLVGRAVDSENRGMGIVKLYNCKLEGVDIEFSDGAWNMRNITGMAYRNINANTRRVYRIAEYDSDAPIDLDLV